ncbi:MAG: DUF2281 domain-containing protein [Thermotogae bacterium]|nr:DUF2281 domain-containing protein [Thermotogota bacterium]
MTLEEKIKMLPEDMRREVEDFVDFLLERERKKSSKKALKEIEGILKGKFDTDDSVELQHRAGEYIAEKLRRYLKT